MRISMRRHPFPWGAPEDFPMRNEPIYWRDLHRIMKLGPGWFEIDGPGTSWWDLRASGFLSGADLRIYRLVD